jgi:hypothetical protein
MDIRKGGRLRLHLTFAASLDTFSILSGMKIEYMYLVATSATSNSGTFKLTRSDLATSILSLDKYNYSFSAANSFVDLTPFLNDLVMSLTSDITITATITGTATLLKLIVGLENIL